MVTQILTERPHDCDMHVWHGETLYEAVPQLINQATGLPWNLTIITFELIMRPAFNHATRFVRLTTIADAGIFKDDAVNGLISIRYAQADVEANLPLSSAEPWRQFMKFSYTDAELGAVEKILWTGKLFVYPAREAATP